MLHYLWTAPAIGVGTVLEVVGGAMLDAGIYLQAHGKVRNLEEDKKIEKSDDNVDAVKTLLHTARYASTIEDYKTNKEKINIMAELLAKKK